ncbi:MAG: AAA family ATPase, partial [Acidimicrobiales bacterium]
MARSATVTQSGLVQPVRRFVDAVTPVITAMAKPPVDAEKLRHDVVLEAFNLTCGFLAADGRQTDDELWALITAFGPLLETQLAGATPATVRGARIVDRLRGSIEEPSPMFRLLLDVDRRDGTAHARAYYDAVMEIAFAVAAADIHTSTDELSSIERFRGRLLSAMHAEAKTSRPAPTPVAEAEPLPPEEKLEDVLAELDALVGLEPVKREVKLVAALTRVEQLRKERDLPVLDHSRHLVFTGNPGTGKTTVARLLSRIYRCLEVVEKGHLVETDRSGLVAGYVGQTATRVVEAFDRADEGTLLVDEAYSLVRGGASDFGREAIDTIVKLVEDRRDRIVVIVAGYPDEMLVFVDANPGLRSRFPKTMHFPDYTTDELVHILALTAAKGRYELTSEAKARAAAWIDAVPRERGFGNGRLSRNLFENAVARQATRLATVDTPTDHQLVTLEADDFPAPGEA